MSDQQDEQGQDPEPLSEDDVRVSDSLADGEVEETERDDQLAD